LGGDGDDDDDDDELFMAADMTTATAAAELVLLLLLDSVEADEWPELLLGRSGRKFIEHALSLLLLLPPLTFFADIRLLRPRSIYNRLLLFSTELSSSILLLLTICSFLLFYYNCLFRCFVLRLVYFFGLISIY